MNKCQRERYKLALSDATVISVFVYSNVSVALNVVNLGTAEQSQILTRLFFVHMSLQYSKHMSWTW